MVLVPTPEPNGWIVQAGGASSAEMAEDFQTARHADRAAELVAYTLLGAAINGFDLSGTASGFGYCRPIPAPPVHLNQDIAAHEDHPSVR